jgi:hypothetical protein
MLHLLPDSYIKEVQKEYRQRSIVAACNLLSFCLLVFILGLVPTFIMVYAEKDQFEKRASAQMLKISDDDQAIAENFESTVKRGLGVIRNNATLTSNDVKHVLKLERTGIIFQGLSVVKEGDSEQARLQGVAATRSDLSNFVRYINTEGEFKVDEVPAGAYTKDRDLPFDIILQKVKVETQ